MQQQTLLWRCGAYPTEVERDFTAAAPDRLWVVDFNALAESFVDSFKTELISDRVWRTHAQAELAIVEWVAWFNHDRLHSSLGDIPPDDLEHDYAVRHLARPVEPARSSTATPAENSAAPNGSGPLAIALPPVEMTSYGQPAGGSRDPGLLSGLPTFPQALRLSSIKQNNITTKAPTYPSLRRTRDGPQCSLRRMAAFTPPATALWLSSPRSDAAGVVL